MNTDRCRQCGWPYDVDADGLCANCRTLKAQPDGVSRLTHLQGVPFKDMKQMDESERLKLIADMIAKNPGKKIAVLVDCGDGHSDKGDRYIRGVRQHVPQVTVIKRVPGPVKDCETITFKLEAHANL